MKKAIITLVITAFITVSILAYLRPLKSTEVPNRNNVTNAKVEFYLSMEDSLQKFNKESENKIGKYEAGISEFKTRIINEKRELAYRTARKLAELNK